MYKRIYHHVQLQHTADSSEFNENCSHFFFFARQSLFCFCKFSANFCFLFVPIWSWLRPHCVICLRFWVIFFSIACLIFTCDKSIRSFATDIFDLHCTILSSISAAFCLANIFLSFYYFICSLFFFSEFSAWSLAKQSASYLDEEALSPTIHNWLGTPGRHQKSSLLTMHSAIIVSS